MNVKDELKRVLNRKPKKKIKSLWEQLRAEKQAKM